MIYIPTAFVVTLLMFISPALGTAALASTGALALVLFFYLYFVTAAIVMDNLAQVAYTADQIQVLEGIGGSAPPPRHVHRRHRRQGAAPHGLRSRGQLHRRGDAGAL
jgi:hypothetical protein